MSRHYKVRRAFVEILTSYSYSYMKFERPPVPWEHKRQDKLASVFMSNCEAKNARNIVLEELIRLLPGV